MPKESAMPWSVLEKTTYPFVGRRSGVTILCVEGLCLAPVEKEAEVPEIIEDLKDAMKERFNIFRYAPSGVLVFADPMEEGRMPRHLREHLTRNLISTDRMNHKTLDRSLQSLIDSFQKETDSALANMAAIPNPHP